LCSLERKSKKNLNWLNTNHGLVVDFTQSPIFIAIMIPIENVFRINQTLIEKL